MSTPHHHCEQLQRLAALLQHDQIDTALETGLMHISPYFDCTACTAASQHIHAAQQRLRFAWAARERFLARNRRLERRAAERQARRAPPAAPSSPITPTLPPAVAAALARAKARASGTPNA